MVLLAARRTTNLIWEIICPIISLLSYFPSQLFILDIWLSSSTVVSPFLLLVEKASSSFDIQGWQYNTVTNQSHIFFSRKILSSSYVSQMYMNAQLVFTLALEEQPLTLLVHTTVLVTLVTLGMEEQVAMSSQPGSSFFFYK